METPPLSNAGSVNNDVIDVNKIQKNIIDKLFIVNGLKCRKLYYNQVVFFCLVDICDCMDYKQLNTTFFLNYLLEKDMFTIDELLELYKDETENDINKDIIESLNKFERRYTYINQKALVDLVNYTSKEHTLNFFYTFVYNKLIPTINNIFFNSSETNLPDCSSENDKEMVNGVKNIIASDISEETDNNSKIVQSKENINALKNSKRLFLVYKISSTDNYIVCDKVDPILLEQGVIQKNNIIIQDDADLMDFYNCLKEEGMNQSRRLKRSIIGWLRSINPDFKKTFDENADLINKMFNQIRPYKIVGNNLFLNSNKIEEVIDVYNRCKNTYIFTNN
ncbi:putative Bro-N domain-containing protein [Yalta virus]|nr:putative Bro-N domain-containing protein [Yalta virus]